MGSQYCNDTFNRRGIDICCVGVVDRNHGRSAPGLLPRYLGEGLGGMRQVPRLYSKSSHEYSLASLKLSCDCNDLKQTGNWKPLNDLLADRVRHEGSLDHYPHKKTMAQLAPSFSSPSNPTCAELMHLPSSAQTLCRDKYQVATMSSVDIPQL